jgi:hypothetical protein
MKFISFAILSALATLTTAAPAPSQGQCVPEQGTSYDYDYDMTGWYAFEDCTWTSLQIETGVLKTRSAYNFIDNGSSFNYCSKYHANTAGAKAVDSEGNRYNLIQQNGGSYDSTYSSTTYAFESVDKYSFKYKFVGQGQLANSVVTFSYHCRNSYDPVTGYHQDCQKQQDWSLKCSA